MSVAGSMRISASFPPTVNEIDVGIRQEMIVRRVIQVRIEWTYLASVSLGRVIISL